MQIISNLSYSTPLACKLDLYLPTTPISSPTPLWITIHGGGWDRGDKTFGAQYNAGLRLCNDGFAIAALNYRLLRNVNYSIVPNPSETNVWPACFNDCQTAVLWLRRNSQRYNFDQTKFYAWGDSAGAHLAALLAGYSTLFTGATSTFSPQVAGAVCHSTPADLRCALSNNPPWNYSGELSLINSTDEHLYEQASPVLHLSHPIAFTQGTSDTTVEPIQADFLETALQNANVAYNRQDYNGGHVFAGLTTDQVQTIEVNAENWLLSV